MHLATTFDVSVPRDRVVAYLANPRHLVLVNREGPVVARSDGPVASGSWFVLAFDQLRVRVEYVAYEPPRRIVTSFSSTGRGAAGARGTQEFVLSELGGGTGTRVEAIVDGEGGWLRWGPLMRASQSRLWRHLRQEIEAST